MIRTLLFGAVLGLLAGQVGLSAEQPTAATAPPRAALIIVANPDQATWRNRFKVDPSSLSALWYDAKMARDTAELVLGIDPRYIYVVGLPADPPGVSFGAANLRSRSATREVILQQIQEFAALMRSSRAELAFVYLSGHGGYVPDGQRVSGRTEYFVAQDAPVFDFELAARLQSINAQWVLYIADTCFSGGLARTLSATQMKSLAVTSEAIRRFCTEAWNRSGLSPRPPEQLPPNWVFLSASRPFEPAYEIRAENTPVSAFTYALYQTLIRRPALTPREVVEQVNLRMNREERLRTNRVLQLAQARGGRLLERPLPVSNNRFPVGHLPVAHSGQSTTLLAGKLAGLSKDERVRARVDGQIVEYDVTEVSLFAASLTPRTQGHVKPTGVQRVERVSAPPRGVRVRVIAAGKGQPANPDPIEGEMLIVVSPNPEGGYQATVSTAGGEYSFPIQSQSEAEAIAQMEALAEQLQQGHTAADLLTYTGEPDDSAILRLTTDRGNSYPQFTVGDDFHITVSSTRSGYLLLIGVEPSGHLSVLYPNAETEQVYLTPNRPLSLPIRATAPPGVTRVVALLYEKPITLPTHLLQTTPGYVHFKVDSRHACAFAERIQAQVVLARSRDLGVPVTNVQSLATAEVWIVVKEANARGVPPARR